MEALKGNYHTYAPTLVMVASADQEVSPKRCQEFAEKTRTAGSQLELVTYEGAEHNFDDPGTKKQSNPANRKATADAMRRAEAFFAAQLLK